VHRWRPDYTRSVWSEWRMSRHSDASASVRARSNVTPSPRHALPCIHASVLGFVKASVSSKTLSLPTVAAVDCGCDRRCPSCGERGYGPEIPGASQIATMGHPHGGQAEALPIDSRGARHALPLGGSARREERGAQPGWTFRLAHGRRIQSSPGQSTRSLSPRPRASP
jgi:hypothetical protein